MTDRSGNGTPLERIPVFRPALGIDTVKHLMDALDVGWLGMGATTKRFEDEIASYLGLQGRFVATTNTGTAALHIALVAAGVGRGDEVITTSFNYVADHQAVLMAGAEVVMCDISDDSLGIDPSKLEALVTKRTKAIIPLHFAGIPCDIEAVHRVASLHRLRVVEDACHAFGTKLGGRKIGSFGDIACFSFDPVKVITSIDGGCVIVNTAEELERLHHLRLLGVDKDTTLRYKNSRAWDYDVVNKGDRYHLTNIMASVGLSQLKRADEFIASRQEICRRYSEAFRELPGVRVPNTDFSDISPFIYSLRILDDRREEMIAHLARRGVDVGVHFIPVHGHMYFAKSRRGDMTVTDRVVREVMTLPLHSNMKPDHIERVVEGVASFFD